MSARLCSSEKNMMGSTYSFPILCVLSVSVDWWLLAEFALTKLIFIERQHTSFTFGGDRLLLSRILLTQILSRSTVFSHI